LTHFAPPYYKESYAAFEQGPRVRLSLRHAILGVLEFQPLHGYALKYVLEQGIATFWPVNLAAIYPSLRRLEQEGLVESHTEPTPSGRPDRKVYRVTGAGREELAQWRRLPPDEDLPRFRNALFLKLLFAKRENLPEVREWVMKAQTEAAGRAREFEEQLDKNDGTPLFVRFLRECGQAHLDLHARLLADLGDRIDEIFDRDGAPDAVGGRAAEGNDSG
jgi:DNA-binding PadR family transcriptional regulator